MYNWATNLNFLHFLSTESTLESYKENPKTYSEVVLWWEFVNTWAYEKVIPITVSTQFHNKNCLAVIKHFCAGGGWLGVSGACLSVGFRNPTPYPTPYPHKNGVAVYIEPVSDNPHTLSTLSHTRYESLYSSSRPKA